MQRLRHRRQRQRAVGADDVEAAILEFEIACGCFQHHGRHGLGLLDDGVGGALERVAPDMHAARAIGAAADRNLVGVALNEADRIKRHAEPFVHHLRVDCLMALAVGMGAGKDHECAARIEANGHAVVEDRRLFDEIANAASAQLAVLLRLGGAFGKAAPVGELQAFVHHAHEFAGVEGDAGMQLVRHGARRNEVAPPDLDWINADHVRGAVEQ